MSNGHTLAPPLVQVNIFIFSYRTKIALERVECWGWQCLICRPVAQRHGYLLLPTVLASAQMHIDRCHPNRG